MARLSRILLWLALCLWPVLAGAQETCVGNRCTDPGSIYRTVNKVMLDQIKANNLRNYAASNPNPSQFYVELPINGALDTNDCLARQVGNGHGPCKTLQRAVNVATSLYDAGSANLQINIGVGVFTKQATLINMPIVGAGSGNLQGTSGSTLYITGAGSGLTTITDDGTAGLSGTLVCTGPGIMTLGGMKITATGSNESDLFQQSGCIVENFTGMNYGSATGPQIQLESNSLWETANSVTFSGGGAALASITGGSVFEFDPSGITLTLSGTPAYSVEVFNVIEGGFLEFPLNLTVSGSATGTRYNVSSNGIIDAFGATLANRLPGNAAGIASYGGRYTDPPLAPTGVASCTNLGTGGACTVSANSDSKHGEIVLTSGSGSTGSSGSVTLTFAENLGVNTIDGMCSPFLDTANGGTTWNTGAYAYLSGYGTNFCTISWTNNSVNLTINSSYEIGYRAGS